MSHQFNITVDGLSFGVSQPVYDAVTKVIDQRDQLQAANARLAELVKEAFEEAWKHACPIHSPRYSSDSHYFEHSKVASALATVQGEG